MKIDKSLKIMSTYASDQEAKLKWLTNVLQIKLDGFKDDVPSSFIDQVVETLNEIKVEGFTKVNRLKHLCGTRKRMTMEIRELGEAMTTVMKNISNKMDALNQMEADNWNTSPESDLETSVINTTGSNFGQVSICSDDGNENDVKEEDLSLKDKFLKEMYGEEWLGENKSSEKKSYNEDKRIAQKRRQSVRFTKNQIYSSSDEDIANLHFKEGEFWTSHDELKGLDYQL